jgi:2,3-dihydro-2,3-dihydroxybenzoate dehydrogenase
MAEQRTARKQDPMTGAADSAPLTRGAVALVTRAAGGIGAEVAARLARQGVQVAADDRDASGLADLVRRLAHAPAPVRAFPGDVASSTAVEELTMQVEQSLGPIEYLVSAAGVLRTGRVAALTDEDWDAAFAVNAHGVFNVSRAVVRRMAARGRGAMVTVASNAATTPRTGMAAYAASKAAAAMFTKCLGLEVAGSGVRCNIVAPGSTDTAMLRALWADGAGPRSSVEGVPGEFRTGIPLGRINQAADVAAAVLFLLSDHAAQITMHELTVDGGASLGR